MVGATITFFCRGRQNDGKWSFRCDAVSGATSGRDCDCQQLRCSDFFGNWLAVSSQASDVNLDRLDGALPAFLNGASAPRPFSWGANV
jgi:hypothetical protein